MRKTDTNISKHLRHAGISMVCTGVLLLVISYILNRTDTNALLFLYALIIVAGAILHIWIKKKESKY